MSDSYYTPFGNELNCLDSATDAILWGWHYDDINSSPASVKHYLPTSNIMILTTLANKDYDFLGDEFVTVNAPTIVYTTANQVHNEMVLVGCFNGKFLWTSCSNGDGVSNAYASSDDGMGIKETTGDGGSDGGNGGAFIYKAGNQTNVAAYQGKWEWYDGDNELIASLAPANVGNAEYSHGLGVHDFNYLYKNGSTYVGSMISANVGDNKQIALGDSAGAFDDWTINVNQAPVLREGTVISEVANILDIKFDGVRFKVTSTSAVDGIIVNGSATTVQDGTLIYLINDTGSPITINHGAANIVCNNSAGFTLSDHGIAKLQYNFGLSAWCASIDFAL